LAGPENFIRTPNSRTFHSFRCALAAVRGAWRGDLRRLASPRHGARGHPAVVRSIGAQGRGSATGAAGQAQGAPRRPLSLPLPSRKSSDRRLTQKPGRSPRPLTPAAATVPEPNLPGPNLPGPNLPGPNQTADLTLPPPPRTESADRRSHHQDRDRGAGDGAGAGDARGCCIAHKEAHPNVCRASAPKGRLHRPRAS
jgi:hypothetical protein